MARHSLPTRHKPVQADLSVASLKISAIYMSPRVLCRKDYRTGVEKHAKVIKKTWDDWIISRNVSCEISTVKNYGLHRVDLFIYITFKTYRTKIKVTSINFMITCEPFLRTVAAWKCARHKHFKFLWFKTQNAKQGYKQQLSASWMRSKNARASLKKHRLK